MIRRRRLSLTSTLLFLTSLLGACAAPFATSPVPREASKSIEPGTQLRHEPVDFAALPGWSADNHAAALQTFVQSCHRIRDTAPRAAAWRAACASARPLTLPVADQARARRFFEARFTPFRIIENGSPDGLVTGYFEPELQGSLRRSARFRYPLYKVPGDLVSIDLGQFRPKLKGEKLAGRISDNRLVPYATRSQIRRGSLAGRNLEILWLENAVDAFFLHIQGSGRVILQDGRVVHVGFAGRNGHAYHAIGRDLIAQGVIPPEKMSLQAIRAWLLANPQRADQLMDRNRSYIFFRFNQARGAVGAMGVPLTPGRSMAVDPTKIPLGAPVWLATTDPVTAGQPLRRLMMAQDTGSAIKGAARGDFFWGVGADAEARAGRMRQRGQFYLLLPKARSGRPLG